MRSRKETAWKKNRRFGEVFGGRVRPRVTDGIFRRLHSIRPVAGVSTPIVIVDNPSRDHYFPLQADECTKVLCGLPGDHVAGITHLWLRRPGGAAHRRDQPLVQFVCGSGVRVVILYAWPTDRRLKLGRARPTGAWARELQRFGAKVLAVRGVWYAEFEVAGLRDYCLHFLLHEVGHHVDWYRRRWSDANRKQCEGAAENYAVSFRRLGRAALTTPD